jgi:hypothetical protein
VECRKTSTSPDAISFRSYGYPRVMHRKSPNALFSWYLIMRCGSGEGGFRLRLLAGLGLLVIIFLAVLGLLAHFLVPGFLNLKGPTMTSDSFFLTGLGALFLGFAVSLKARVRLIRSASSSIIHSTQWRGFSVSAGLIGISLALAGLALMLFAVTL